MEIWQYYNDKSILSHSDSHADIIHFKHPMWHVNWISKHSIEEIPKYLHRLELKIARMAKEIKSNQTKS